MPKCLILFFELISNPNPSPPITTPDLITVFSFIIQFDKEQFEEIKTFAPIDTFGPIELLDSIITFLSIKVFW